MLAGKILPALKSLKAPGCFQYLKPVAALGPPPAASTRVKITSAIMMRTLALDSQNSVSPKIATPK